MKFYESLYLSDKYKEKKEEIICKMQKGKYPLSAYILTLIEKGENQLEFFPTIQLYQGYIDTESLYVIGIAESYLDAVYLVEDMTRETYAQTGTADIRSFLLQSKEIDES